MAHTKRPSAAHHRSFCPRLPASLISFHLFYICGLTYCHTHTYTYPYTVHCLYHMNSNAYRHRHRRQPSFCLSRCSLSAAAAAGVHTHTHTYQTFLLITRIFFFSSSYGYDLILWFLLFVRLRLVYTHKNVQSLDFLCLVRSLAWILSLSRFFCVCCLTQRNKIMKSSLNNGLTTTYHHYSHCTQKTVSYSPPPPPTSSSSSTS